MVARTPAKDEKKRRGPAKEWIVVSFIFIVVVIAGVREKRILYVQHLYSYIFTYLYTLLSRNYRQDFHRKVINTLAHMYKRSRDYFPADSAITKSLAINSLSTR